jgi:hypothetical protein
MENCQWIEKLSLKILMVVPGICASFIAIFLLLLRTNQHLHLSDAAQGAVCGFFLGISFLCLLVMVMKQRLAE